MEKNQRYFFFVILYIFLCFWIKFLITYFFLGINCKGAHDVYGHGGIPCSNLGGYQGTNPDT